MATILQLRRGTTVQHSTFTGAVGEVTVDTTKDTVVVHDGSTVGGFPLATEAYVASQIQSKDNSDEITEGSTNLYFTTERARNAISAGTGISITNGEISTTVTQYTDADARSAISVSGDLSYDSATGVISYTEPTMYADSDARAAISVTDAGGDGSLSYDNATGVITYTGPSASDVRAHFSAGTGITLTNGSIAVDNTIATKTYADSAATTAVAAVIDAAPATLDTLNELAAALGDDANFSTTITNSIATKLDSSAVSAFGLTLVDDADAAAARSTLGLGTAATTAATDYATAAQGTKADAALPAANFNSTFDARLALKTTADLNENTNLYFTNARARAAISVTDSGGEGSLSYDNASGVITYTGPSAANILDALKTVDGSGSGLDADLLDGNSSAHYRINVYDAAGNLLN